MIHQESTVLSSEERRTTYIRPVRDPRHTLDDWTGRRDDVSIEWIHQSALVQSWVVTWAISKYRETETEVRIDPDRGFRAICSSDVHLKTASISFVRKNLLPCQKRSRFPESKPPKLLVNAVHICSHPFTSVHPRPARAGPKG